MEGLCRKLAQQPFELIRCPSCTETITGMTFSEWLYSDVSPGELDVNYWPLPWNKLSNSSLHQFLRCPCSSTSIRLRHCMSIPLQMYWTRDGSSYSVMVRVRTLCNSR